MMLAIVLLSAATAIAQQPAQAPKTPGGEQVPTPPAAQPASPALTAPAPPNESYSYDPAGRRDPFVSLIGTGEPTGPVGRPGQGVAGMVTNEVSVRGVMQNGPTLLALISGPDKKTYIVRPGDKLLDGTIKAVNEQGIVVVQNVNDPLSLDKTREVRKVLRSLEDAK